MQIIRKENDAVDLKSLVKQFLEPNEAIGASMPMKKIEIENATPVTLHSSTLEYFFGRRMIFTSHHSHIMIIISLTLPAKFQELL